MQDAVYQYLTLSLLTVLSSTACIVKAELDRTIIALYIHCSCLQLNCLLQQILPRLGEDFTKNSSNSLYSVFV